MKLLGVKLFDLLHDSWNLQNLQADHQSYDLDKIKQLLVSAKIDIGEWNQRNEIIDELAL